MNKPWLIGIGGTNASGKDTLAEYLASKHGYLFVSTGDMVRQAAMQRYGNILRPTQTSVGNELRAEGGAGVLVNLCIEHFKKSGNKVGLLAASIRTRGEIDEIKNQGGILLFVDADPKVRYERLKTRQRADDFITFEKFQAEQQAEWHQSDNPAEFSIKTVKQAADFAFTNNGDIKDFLKTAENTLFE